MADSNAVRWFRLIYDQEAFREPTGCRLANVRAEVHRDRYARAVEPMSGLYHDDKRGLIPDLFRER